MIVLLNLVTAIGWRGAVGLAVGGMAASLAAFPTGRWVERAVCVERIGRATADEQLREMELQNARIDAALQARRSADRDGLDAAGGGLPDDGFRRD